jgi:hypothetical protein
VCYYCLWSGGDRQRPARCGLAVMRLGVGRLATLAMEAAGKACLHVVLHGTAVVGSPVMVLQWKAPCAPH